MIRTHMIRKLWAILLGCWAFAAVAQDGYPKKVIRLVVAYEAGGPTDILARIYAAQLSKNLGQPVVVDNRAGAAGIIGTELVAKAPADGYTLLLGVSSSHVLHPASGRKIPYDPVKDFEPVAMAAIVPMVLMVNPQVLPVTDVKGLIAELKANPGKYKFGSSGNGGISHLCFELFKQRAGIVDFTHIPYKGTGPATNDLMAGTISAVCEGVGGAAQHVKEGRLRGIAATGLQRLDALPNIPTVAESGLPGFEAYTWNMFFVPTGTPEAIVTRLNTEINRVAKDPSVRQRLDGMGVVVVDDSTPERLKSFLPTEIAKWTAVVRAPGVDITP